MNYRISSAATVSACRWIEHSINLTEETNLVVSGETMKHRPSLMYPKTEGHQARFFCVGYKKCFWRGLRILGMNVIARVDCSVRIAEPRWAFCFRFDGVDCEFRDTHRHFSVFGAFFEVQCGCCFAEARGAFAALKKTIIHKREAVYE